MTNYGPVSLSGNSIETIQPGIYSQISLTGNARLKMSPGIYVIEGGGFSASGNATVTGSRVMIVNAGTNYPGTGGTYGSITIGGNARVNLSPATIGTDAGIVFFQPPDNTEVLTLTGNSSGITGTIYAPTAPFSERGNAAINASLIVDTIAISSNGVADVKTAGGGSPGGVIPNPSGASTGLMALNFVLADAGIVSVVNPIAASRTVMQTAAKRSAPNVVTTSRPTAIDPAAVDELLIDGLSVRSRRIADRPGEPLKWSL